MSMGQGTDHIDPRLLRGSHELYKWATRLYHRAESTGVEKIPETGALLVGNHSGGIIAMDVPVISVPFYERFGPETPLHVLAHDMLMIGPTGALMRKMGFLPATREGARQALADGGFTIVFPGGDREATRPTRDMARIDFGGRTGYARTAIEAGVPIVPVVSIGGQEALWVLARSERLARLMPWTKLFRTSEVPIVVGAPWGVTMGFPPPIPLPSKIVTRFLDPIAPADADDDPAALDALVRERMQAALDDLAAQRRFPVLG
jgi:1-acyl-sn-glycerol-3-phosphate acyltransferase